MRIQHNIMAMNAYRNYNTNTKALSGNLEKLSSGYKINRAGDDAAGLAISEKMRAQITGLDAAQKNVKDGISLVKTGEGAMQEIQDMLNRMDYLATQSANGTYDNEVDRLNLQKEVDALKTEINRIADSANFNGIKLLDGSLASTGADTNSKFKGWDSIKGTLAAGLTDIDATNATSKMNLCAITTTSASLKVAAGDTVNLKFAMSDGKTYDLTATVKVNDAGDKYSWVDADGNELVAETALSSTTAHTLVTITAALGAAVKNSDLGNTFNVNWNSAGGDITLTAKEKGAGPAIVTSVDMTGTKKDGTTTLLAVDTASKGRAAVDASTKAGEDAYQALDLSKAQIFDHAVNKTSLEKAIFEINGEKFVFIENGKVTDENIAKMKEAGVEHWVEVKTESTSSTSAPVAADISKMVEKIKFTTGLDVKQGKETAAGSGKWADDATAGTLIKINDGSSSKKGGGLTLQIGDTSDKFNQMKVQIGDMHVNAMGTGKTTLDGQEVNVTKTIEDIDIGTQEGAQDAIAVIKNAINYVSGIRGDLGAIQNRLEHTGNNLSVMAENIQDAESTIRDTDVANEMMSYVKNNILVQSAQAMLAQANQVPQGVLQLLG